MTQQDQEMRIIAYANFSEISPSANCEECGAPIPIELSLCPDCAWEGEQHKAFNLRCLGDDSGALTLPYALLGIAAYTVYWMIAHGVFQALTALQAGR